MNVSGSVEDEIQVEQRVGEPDLHRVRSELLGVDHMGADHPGELGACSVCLELTRITRRQCCDFLVCKECLRRYYNTLVSEGIVKIPCIGNCEEFATDDEIVEFFDSDMLQRFQKFMVDANQDPNRKTCPGCNHITDLDPNASPGPRMKTTRVQVTCSECQLVWCFRCQSPWHESSCEKSRKADRLFQKWTKGREDNSVRNAQKCPECKIFIQRSSGCDFMTCSRCSTSFCYVCGEDSRNKEFVSNHNYHTCTRHRPRSTSATDTETQHSFRRCLIRGFKMCGTIILMTIVYLLIPVVAGTILGLLSPIICLVMVIYVIAKAIVKLIRKKMEQRRRARSIARENAIKQRQAKAPVEFYRNSVFFLELPETAISYSKTARNANNVSAEVHSKQLKHKERPDREENATSRTSAQTSASPVYEAETSSNLFRSRFVNEVTESETAADARYQDGAGANDRASGEDRMEILLNPAKIGAKNSVGHLPFDRSPRSQNTWVPHGSQKDRDVGPAWVNQLGPSRFGPRGPHGAHVRSPSVRYMEARRGPHGHPIWAREGGTQLGPSRFCPRGPQGAHVRSPSVRYIEPRWGHRGTPI